MAENPQLPNNENSPQASGSEQRLVRVGAPDANPAIPDWKLILLLAGYRETMPNTTQKLCLPAWFDKYPPLRPLFCKQSPDSFNP